MGPKTARQTLPTHTAAAGGAYPAAYPAAAPQKQRRGWFGRNKAAAAGAGAGAGAGAAAAPGQQYNAQPFNQPTGPARDMEMGAVPNSGESCIPPSRKLDNSIKAVRCCRACGLCGSLGTMAVLSARWSCT